MVKEAVAKWPDKANDKPAMMIIAPMIEATHGNRLFSRLAAGGVMGIRRTLTG